MTINLSQFVDKQVKVTFQNEETHFGRIVCCNFGQTYRLALPNNTHFSYFMDGRAYYHANEYDIVKIELVEPTPTESTNKLDPKTWRTIASALTPEAIKYIEKHEKYAEVMLNIIQEFVEQNVGTTDGQLPFMIFDRIFLIKNVN